MTFARAPAVQSLFIGNRHYGGLWPGARTGMQEPESGAAMVALIKASACEPVESRRMAATLLLDLLRSVPGTRDLKDGMARITDGAPRDVSGEMFDFVEELGLGGPADLLP